jgi:predicted metal-dependent hydrolase
LAKKHPHSLEYVIVHEMAHLVERSHGKGFAKLMDTVLADWRSRRNGLNAAPLGDEAW